MEKKIVLIFLILLVYSISNVDAQEKCKYVKEGTDKLSGKSFRIIGAFFLHPSHLIQMDEQWLVNITKLGDDFTLDSSCDIAGELDDKMEKGDSISLKLDNDKIITIYASSVLAPKKVYNYSQVLTSYGSKYPINIKDINLLSSSKVVYAQIHLGSRIRNTEIKDKDAITLQKGVTCLLK